MGLFDKKYCDICGEKIGFLGNKKLEDGNLCKNCAAKLSPWFSERRQSTVEEIKQQLDYREENKAAVVAFHVTRSLGDGTKVLIDDDACKFMVTGARNLADANPDVMDFADVTGCRIDVDESRTELKQKDKEGNDVSYNPPRYKYSYNFNVIINVNNPYFNEIRFRLNGKNVELNNVIVSAANRTGVNPHRSIDYCEYEKIGKEIVEALTKIRTTVRENVEAANAPKASIKCPYCGAVVVPDAKGRCEFCGSVIDA